MKKIVKFLKAPVEKIKGLGKKVLKAPVEKFKGLGKKTKKVVCLVLAAAVALAGFGIWKWCGGSAETAAKASGESIVRRGNLTNSITGSGTVEPIEQREIVPEVKGKILESPFNEGDSVQEGDILYRFEMTAAENAIESAVNSVEKAQTNLSNRQSNLEKVRENISKLTIKATTSGKISGLALRIGEDAQGKICTITNFKEQTATIPFSSAHINKISVGDSVDVAIDKYMINTTGKVIRKYTAPDTLSSGAVIYNVEIRIDNKYTLEENVNVTATVKTASGNVDSASYGSVKYADPVTVNADQKGEVSKINFKNGDWVNEGEVIALLKNKDLNDDLRTAQQSVKEAEMNLTEAMNNLEDKEEEANEYIVTSPINGVVLYKDYEVGDTISGQNAPSMMIVADMSKMKFTISADELDISKIQLGQSVSVTADALQGQRLVGNITSISKVGTASNGVTNYPVEVTIDQPGDLMPGMNVNAQIVVEQSYNCHYLPAQAVEYYDGKYYVTVIGEVENMPEPQTFGGQGGFGQGRGGFGQGGFGQRGEEGQKPEGATQSGENKAETPEASGQGREGFGQGGFGPRGGNRQMPEGAVQNGENKAETPTAPGQDEVKPGGEKKQETTGQNTEKPDEEKKEQTTQGGKQSEGNKNNSANAGRQGNQRNGNRNQENYKIKYYSKAKRVEVKLGIKTDTSYEILEGVEYGQVVKNTAQATQRGVTNSGSRGGFGGMGGGSFGGGSFGGGGNNRNWNRSGGNMGGRR